MLLDTIARGFLALSNDIIIIPIIVLGYIWVDRKLFYHVTCLLLFSMIVNVALKWTFQVALAPSIGNPHGYAFPSGHMQSSTVFYGWLAYKIDNKVFRIAALAVILGVGFALMHFGYHNITDLVGAIVVAVGLMVLYRVSVTRFPKNLARIIIIASTILLVYIVLRNPHPQIPNASILAYYSLLGFVISDNIFNKKLSNPKTLSTRRKILASLLCFSLICLIHYGFVQLQYLFTGLPLYVTELQSLAIGFALPFSRAYRLPKF